jgi:flagellin
MALVVNTNVASITSQMYVNQTNKDMADTMARLSSGKRINTAADDAAGLAISSRLTSQVKGINQAIRNAQDGQSLIDTTEGAHAEITTILQRMRELAIQSVNDTNVSADRTALQSEVAQLISEVDRIGVQTTWNGMSILDGSFTSKQLQVGPEGSQTVSFSVDSAKAANIGNYQLKGDAFVAATDTIAANAALVVSGHLGASTLSVAAGASVKDVAATVNAATASTGVTATAVTKAKLSGLSAAESVAFTLTGAAAATISVSVSDTSHLGAIKDAVNAKAGVTGITAAFGDDTSEIVLTSLTGEDIAISGMDTTTNTTTITLEALDENGADLSTADTATIVESGGSATGVVKGNLSLNSIKSFTVSGDNATTELGFFHTLNGTTAGGTASLSAVSGISIATASGAASAINVIDGAIAKVNAARGDLGALSNRLDNTVSNLSNVAINVESSRSQIEDADFAAESANLAKQQIMLQAGTAMLAQANAAQQNVLSLLS